MAMDPEQDGSIDQLVDKEPIALEIRMPCDPANRTGAHLDARADFDLTPSRDLHGWKRRAQQRQRILAFVKREHHFHWRFDHYALREFGQPHSIASGKFERCLYACCSSFPRPPHSRPKLIR